MDDAKTDILIEKYIALRSNIVDDIPDIKFCSNNEITLGDLDRLKSLYPDWATRVLTRRRSVYNEATIRVDDALYRAAKMGDVRAAELWYKRFDNWDPKNPSGKSDPTDKKTWAEMLEAANKAKRKAKKKAMKDAESDS